jgi:hypothetical protein
MIFAVEKLFVQFRKSLSQLQEVAGLRITVERTLDTALG